MLPQSDNLNDRTAPARFIVLHTTSTTFSQRVGGTLAGALERYRTTAAPYYGHGIFDSTGAYGQLAEYDARAQHSATLDWRYETGADGSYPWRWTAKPSGAADYIPTNRDPAIVWDWWDARWPGVSSPLDLIGTRNPNNHSIGLDLMPTVDGDFPRAQLEAAAKLCCDLMRLRYATARMGGHLPTVVTHSDVDPMRRGAVYKSGKVIGRDWDLGSRFDYALFAELLAELSP